MCCREDVRGAGATPRQSATRGHDDGLLVLQRPGRAARRRELSVRTGDEEADLGTGESATCLQPLGGQCVLELEFL